MITLNLFVNICLGLTLTLFIIKFAKGVFKW